MIRLLPLDLEVACTVLTSKCPPGALQDVLKSLSVLNSEELQLESVTVVIWCSELRSVIFGVIWQNENERTAH